MIDVRRSSILTIASASLALGAGCSEDFDPYNEVSGFRILALRADRPTLAPGETAVIEALEVVPPGEAVRRSWSWCPIAGSSDRGYRCAVEEAELQAALDEAVGPGVLMVPPFALSETSSAAFSHTLPPALLRGICDALGSLTLPVAITPPPCDEYFQVTIRVEATAPSRTITAIKELRLLYSADGERNQNPEILGLTVRSPDEPESAAKVVTAGVPFSAAREGTYTLALDVPESASEPYTVAAEVEGAPRVSVQESLVVTWFVEAGEPDSTRTTYIAGELPIEALRQNEWTAPKAADYPGTGVRMFFVVRDDRGGASWLAREAVLAP